MNHQLQRSGMSIARGRIARAAHRILVRWSALAGFAGSTGA
jgi:hypothetical protein